MCPYSYELHCKVGDSNFQDQAYKQLVGVIVLTRSEVIEQFVYSRTLWVLRIVGMTFDPRPCIV